MITRPRSGAASQTYGTYVGANAEYRIAHDYPGDRKATDRIGASYPNVVEVKWKTILTAVPGSGGPALQLSGQPRIREPDRPDLKRWSDDETHRLHRGGGWSNGPPRPTIRKRWALEARRRRSRPNRANTSVVAGGTMYVVPAYKAN